MVDRCGERCLEQVKQLHVHIVPERVERSLQCECSSYINLRTLNKIDLDKAIWIPTRVALIKLSVIFEHLCESGYRGEELFHEVIFYFFRVERVQGGEILMHHTRQTWPARWGA